MRRIPGRELEPESNQEFILRNAQDRQLDYKQEAIDATMIDEREIKIQKVSGVVKLCTKIDGTVYSVTLS